MEPETLDVIQMETMILGLSICIKKGYLQMKLQTRLVSSDLNKLVCSMPPPILIKIGNTKSPSEEIPLNLLHILSTLKVTDLCLELPGPYMAIRHGSVSMDEFFCGSYETMRINADASGFGSATVQHFNNLRIAYDKLKIPTILYQGPTEIDSDEESFRTPLILPTRITSLEIRFLTERDTEDNEFFSLRFPPYLNALNLRETFNQSIDDNPNLLPNSLENLSIGHQFSQTIDNLPPNLLHLSLGIGFNGSLDNLPQNLLSLNLGNCNKPVDKLPSTLQTLNLGISFNLEVNHLPPSLKELTFNLNFNKSIDLLPDSIETLKLLGSKFNQPILKFPLNLKTLVLERSFWQSLRNLPQGLERLIFTVCYSNRDRFIFLIPFYTFNQLPSSLLELIMPRDYNLGIDNLPRNLKTLQTGQYFNQRIDSLPQSLNELVLGDEFNQPIDNPPLMLTNLTIGNRFNRPIDNLPLTLTNLIIGNCFNKRIDNIPLTLTHLTLGDSFNKKIDSLSKLIHLTYLSLGDEFDRPINSLPTSLETLNLGNDFDQEIDILPANLTTLSLGSKFDQPIKFLPPTLEYLMIDLRNYTHSVEYLRERETRGLWVIEV